MLGVVPWIVVGGGEINTIGIAEIDGKMREEERTGGRGLKGIYIQPCVLDSGFFITPTIIYLLLT